MSLPHPPSNSCDSSGHEQTSNGLTRATSKQLLEKMAHFQHNELDEPGKQSKRNAEETSEVKANGDTNSKAFSEMYNCEEDDCKLNVGLVLPISEYADRTASNVRELINKVTIALSPNMTAEEKESEFLKVDVKQTQVGSSLYVAEAAWKATLAACPHRAKCFKELLGKPLNSYETENINMVQQMIAHANNIPFMHAKKMDTVVIGKYNAVKIKDAINANFWSTGLAEESVLHGNVVFSDKIKRAIFIPDEKLLYGPEIKFETAIKTIMQTMENLSRCNKCRIIMLPIFRHLDFPEVSQKFIEWYLQKSETDDRLIGAEEIDNKKLIHWLNATPADKDAVQFVGANGILTENGTKKLVEYLNANGTKKHDTFFRWFHRDTKEKHAEKKWSRGNESDTLRAHQFQPNFNRDSNRGTNRNQSRGFKRKTSALEEMPTDRRFNAYEQIAEYCPSKPMHRH